MSGVPHGALRARGDSTGSQRGIAQIAATTDLNESGFEQPLQPREFLSGPDRGQFPAPLGSVPDDVTPCVRGLGEPSVPFEQEGAGIDRSEVIRIELVRASPVGERTIQIASPGLDLTLVARQARITGGELQGCGYDVGRSVVIMRRQKCRRQQTQLAYLAGRAGHPLAMNVDRCFRFAKRGLRSYPLVPNLVGSRVDGDRALVLLDCPPDCDPAVALQQVAILAQQHRVFGFSHTCLALFTPPDLGLKQRLGCYEVCVLTEGLIPFEQLILSHPDHASFWCPSGLHMETAAGSEPAAGQVGGARASAASLSGQARHSG